MGNVVENEVINASGVRFRWDPLKDYTVDLDWFQIGQGERIFIEGPSGSGKSTLLSLLTGVVVPDEGTVSVLGQAVSEMNGARRDHFRADHIGYIFQMFNLIPYLSVVENVTLPCRFSKRRHQRTKDRSNTASAEARRLLDHLGMGAPDLLHRPVSDLSVGQRQRVAAARALIGSPEILIADEPTSSLDTAHREAFIKLLFGECADQGTSLVFVSHDTTLSGLFDRTIQLSTQGRIV